VDYLKPTPMGVTLEIRGKVKEIKGRKIVIEEWILAEGVITVRGEVVAVQVPEQLVKELLENARK
jgi:acyl-CoA thioesterase FadM